MSVTCFQIDVGEGWRLLSCGTYACKCHILTRVIDSLVSNGIILKRLNPSRANRYTINALIYFAFSSKTGSHVRIDYKVHDFSRAISHRIHTSDQLQTHSRTKLDYTLEREGVPSNGNSLSCRRGHKTVTVTK